MIPSASKPTPSSQYGLKASMLAKHAVGSIQLAAMDGLYLCPSWKISHTRVNGQTVHPPSRNIVTRTQKYWPCCHWTKGTWRLNQRFARNTIIAIVETYVTQMNQPSNSTITSCKQLKPSRNLEISGQAIESIQKQSNNGLKLKKTV